VHKLRYLSLLFSFIFVFTSTLKSKELEKISLQLQWKHQFEFAGFYMAKEKGYYKDSGIDVNFIEYNKNINIIDTVLSNQNTYGLTYSNLVVEYLKGKPLIFVANFLKQSPLAIVTKKNIHLPSDLKGKRVMGVGEDVNSAMFLIMFKKFGLSLDDFQNTPHTFSIDDFINDKVDAMTVFTTNETYYLDKLGIEYNLLNPTVYGSEFYDLNLFTSREELLHHPERVNNFKDASIRGWKYALENIDETINLIMKKYNTQGKTYESLLYEATQIRNVMLPSVHPIGNIDLFRVELMVDNYLNLGLIPKNANINLTNFIFKYKNKKLNLTPEEKNYLQMKQNIKICVDPNLLPFEAIQDGKYIGIGADIIDILKNRFNLPLTLLETKNFKDSVNKTKRNICDMIPMIMDNKKDKQINFSQSYLETPIALITKNDVPFISDIHLLRDKKVVTVKGYSVSRIIRENYPHLDLVEVDSIYEAFDLVRSGKAFAMAEKVISINNIFHKDRIDDLKISSKFDEKIYFSMGFNIDNNYLPSIINKALEHISTAEKNTIYNKWVYFLDEVSFKNSFPWQVFFIFVVIISFVVFWLIVVIKLNKKYKKAKIEAEKLSLVKTNFLAIISHEIRTPMNVILGMTYILGKTNLSEKQREYNSKIVSSSKSLLRLLNDILDAAKIEVGKLVIEKHNFDLKIILDEIYEMFDFQVTEKNIEFHITYDNSLPLNLYGDSLRISQILINLLSNAVKFTDYGKIELSIELLPNDQYQFIVSDTGIGLTEKQLETLFDSFTQGDESTTRKYGGTGLGLSIAKELVELHDGKIQVKSEYGVGSKFIFTLQLPQSEKIVSKNNCPLTDSLSVKTINGNLLKSVSKEEIDLLINKLQQSIVRKRPNEFEPILQALNSIKLAKEEKKIILKVSKLLKKYDFKMALKVLNER